MRTINTLEMLIEDGFDVDLRIQNFDNEYDPRHVEVRLTKNGKTVLRHFHDYVFESDKALTETRALWKSYHESKAY